MNNLISSDVKGLKLEGRGRIVNVDMDAYNDYMHQQQAIQHKDSALTQLQDRINILETTCARILALLEQRE